MYEKLGAGGRDAGGRAREGWLWANTRWRRFKAELASKSLPPSAVWCPCPQGQTLSLCHSLARSHNPSPSLEHPCWRALPKGQPAQAQLLPCPFSVDFNSAKGPPTSIRPACARCPSQRAQGNEAVCSGCNSSRGGSSPLLFTGQAERGRHCKPQRAHKSCTCTYSR